MGERPVIFSEQRPQATLAEALLDCLGGAWRSVARGARYAVQRGARCDTRR